MLQALASRVWSPAKTVDNEVGVGVGVEVGMGITTMGAVVGVPQEMALTLVETLATTVQTPAETTAAEGVGTLKRLSVSQSS